MHWIVPAFHHFLYPLLCRACFLPEGDLEKPLQREGQFHDWQRWAHAIESGLYDYVRTCCVSVPIAREWCRLHPSCRFCSAGFACRVKRTDGAKESVLTLRRVQEMFRSWFTPRKFRVHTGGRTRFWVGSKSTQGGIDGLGISWSLSLTLYACIK